MEIATTTWSDVTKHENNQSVAMDDTDVRILATSHMMYKIGE